MLTRLLIFLSLLSALQLTGCIITGKVVDQNGKGIKGVTVELTGVTNLTTTTNNDGGYIFGNFFDFLLGTKPKGLTLVTPGNYTVTPYKEGYNFSPNNKTVSITAECYGPFAIDLSWPVGGVNFEVQCSNCTTTYLGGIIDTDTGLNETGIIYELTDNLQISEGVTLTIGPGALIDGEGYEIRVWGTLNAIGTPSTKITFNDVTIAPYIDNYSSPALIDIEYARFNGGTPYKSEDGHDGILMLKNCELYETSLIRLGDIRGDCYIEKNTFSESSGIEAELTILGPITVYIRNNFFRGQIDYAIQYYSWRNNLQVVAEYNSFMSTDRIAIKLRPGTLYGSIVAANNYWNTTDTNVIDGMIYDKNDDLEINFYVEDEPFLTEPHPDTPVLP